VGEEVRLRARAIPTNSAAESDSAAAHILSGEALDGLGRTREAIEEFREATKAAPGDLNAGFGLGYLYWKQRQDEEAKAAFETVLATDAKHAQALAYLGDIEMRQGSEKAFAHLMQAVELDSGIRIAHSDLGAIYMEQKRYPQALAALQQAVRLDPAQPDTHFRLGRLYQAMGDPAAAKQEFEKVRELQKKAEDSVMEKMAARRHRLNRKSDASAQLGKLDEDKFVKRMRR
jgi:tetratricopeptide (TPR) repeat protein